MTHVYAHMTPEQQRERDERDLEILRLYAEGMSSHEIARHTGLGQTSVSRVIREVRPFL